LSKTKLLVATISMIVFVSAGILFFMGTTVIDSVRIIGNNHTTRYEIMNMVGIYDSSTVLEVFVNPTERIEDVSYVTSLEVNKEDLKNVIITVYEKDIIGYIDYMGKYICIDSRGYIVDYTEIPDPMKPKIQGIALTAFTIDEPIDISEKIVTSIDTIYRNAVAFDIPIEWIDFSYGEGNKIVLRTGKIQIRMGDISRIEEKFESIKEVLKVLSENEEGILIIENMEDDIIFKKIEN